MKAIKKLLTITLLLNTLICFGQTPNLSSEKIWAIKLNDGQYELKSKVDSDLKIYTGNRPEDIQWKTFLNLKKGKSLKVENPGGERVFFATVINRDTVVFSERRLVMTGSPNFRDLGGLKTKDGRNVHWGKMFRCGDMGKLEEKDLEIIQDLKIATVVDFRGEEEIARSPDKYPTDSEIKRVNTVIGASNPNRATGLMEALRDPDMTREKMDSLFNLYYKYSVGSIVDFKPLFDELLSAAKDEAVLFHCSAGKDRTGIGSALILYALGVPEETIVEEYYLSNLYTQDLLKGAERYKGVNPKALEVLSGVQPHYIKTTFAEIKNQYGSIDNILEKELGLDKVKRQALIANYTY